jgi:hypothetical protein
MISNYRINKLFLFLPPKPKGVLAQLARATGWQSVGQGFDSPILHKLGNREQAIGIRG